MEVKKDPYVIVLATVVVLVLGGLTYAGKISWIEMVGGVALFGLPSVVGRKAGNP